MADCVEEQLLGFLLGALEESQQEWVEEQLKIDPKLRQQLKRLEAELAPLSATRCEFTLPEDLAARTCRFVAMHAESQAEKKVAEPRKATDRPVPRSLSTDRAVAPSGSSAGFSWKDLVVAAGIVGAATLLIFPAIQNSRYNSRLAACQDNLRWVGQAMSQYSQQHNDFFPPIAEEGPLSAAGIVAPALLDSGYLDSSRRVVCPASELACDRQFRVPTVGELLAAKGSGELNRLRANMGGSYGYPLGFVENSRYHSAKNMRRPYFPLVSDAPSSRLPGHQTLNHGGRGQNVLFEDFHVRFLTSPELADPADDFFTNDTGIVAAGRHRNDSVIGSSSSVPIRFVGSGN